ncbi:zinc finger protein 260-like [Anthonomus grandis grandis]|uniref:zinc finger protein 260-like n=1 Tax=Anthonomus grandis grandis TaxID=2921223 RepID=UPI0021661233|nr:zinc finger protein 260-like [Anthonomus grandis grandis]
MDNALTNPMENVENSCLACLGTDNLTITLSEARGILEEFEKTFNFKLEINESLPKYLCSTCEAKLLEASKFIEQVQNSINYIEELRAKEEKEVDLLNLKEEDAASQEPPEQYFEEDNEFNDNEDDKNFEPFDEDEIDSDDEPLIKFVPKKRKKKRETNTFNPKLKRIPLEVIEKTINEYREECRVNSNCVLCDFKGLNVRNLSCHMIFKHRETKSTWCSRCNSIVEDLDNHKKTHTNRIWCRFCKKGITRCHYMEHLKAHAGLEYQCDQCQKRYISEKALEDHKLKHLQNPQAPYQCPVCKKNFKLLKSLEDHVQTHGRYICDVCEKRFEIPELLNSHLCSGKVEKVHEVTKTLSESEDEEVQVLNEESDVKKEENFTEDSKECTDGDIKPISNSDIRVESLTCHFCQRTYKTAYKLQKHIEAHMGIFLVKCQYCDKGFSSKADMLNHERVHTKEKPFICSTCGKGFVSGATLRIHMKQHTGKTEVCELCQKRFCRKSELKLHMQKHRGERPFLCTDCGKSFAQKSHLTCHLTMHSEERPYACMKCDKAFKKKELLKHHMKLHGEKDFKCSICFYECHKKYRLQQHMKMHEGKTGLKLNSCQLCTRAFSSIQLLNIHMGNVHNVVV